MVPVFNKTKYFEFFRDYRFDKVLVYIAFYPRGVLKVYMTGGGGGGSNVFLGLKIYMLGIFLGQVICRVFF